MRRIIQFIGMIIISVTMAISCDKITDSNSNVENNVLAENEMITTSEAEIPGYGIAVSTAQNFSDGGFAGWSTPSGTVVTSGGFQLTGGPAAVNVPGMPESVWPHYIFGTDEYGWVIQDNQDGSPSSNSLIYNVHAEEPTGYEIVTSSELEFGDGGWGGWSCPAGKVVLGGGFEATGPVQASAPGSPESDWPHYTFGYDEYGWVIQDSQDGASNTIKIYVVCADKPEGYEIIQSTEQSFSTTGWGGWSVPEGGTILGGGFVSESPVMASAPAGPNSEWPHYNFGEEEYGWVIQSAGGGATTIYAIAAGIPAPAPEMKNDCKKGGWQDYGFKNQGQCIRFVNTGKDSR